MMEDQLKNKEKEANYYKKQVDELTGNIIGLQYRVAEMGNAIRQMQSSFGLLSGLQHHYTSSQDFSLIYDHLTEEIITQMHMDAAALLLPGKDFESFFPDFIKGNIDPSIKNSSIKIPPEIWESGGSLLVNSKTTTTPFIETLRIFFSIPHFVLTPVIFQENILAFVFTGRRAEATHQAASMLQPHDAHAIETIAQVIATIKHQHDHIQIV